MSSISIANIIFNPIGPDRHLERLVLKSNVYYPINLAGWQISDLKNHAFTFSNFIFVPYTEVNVWTGHGVDDVQNIYMNLNKAIWNNEGDLAILRDNSGGVISQYSYGIHGETNMLNVDVGFAAVHAALLRNGNVLFFSYDKDRENDENKSFWRIFDPMKKTFLNEIQILNRNLFCSGHVFLPDGRLLVAAGQSYNWFPFTGKGADHDIHVFDPSNNTWSRFRDMPSARYYPTCTALPDGNVLIASGAVNRYTAGGNVINDEYEIFYGQSNTLSPPSRFNPGHLNNLYPFIHVLPRDSGSGHLFVFSKNEARIFDLDGNRWFTKRFMARSTYDRNYPHQGSSVVLPIKSDNSKETKVLIVGGQGEMAHHGTEKATDKVELFVYDKNNISQSDIRKPNGGHLNHGRFMSDTVILPDGRVLIVNGSGRGAADHSHEPVFQMVIFDPETELWDFDVGSIHNPRMYHSSAILLPDASVLIGGNTEHWNPGHPIEDGTLEMIRPAYLFATDRPTIIDIDENISYNGVLKIKCDRKADEIQKVTLVRPSSVTHSLNMDQRCVELGIISRANKNIRVQTPINPTIAVPGFYMVFLLNHKGVPSTAKFVNLGRVNPGKQLVISQSFNITESQLGDFDTGVVVNPGDEVELIAGGSIWAGVFGTTRNGPKGWSNVDHNPKFPLNVGPEAHPFSLIGRYANQNNYFYIGDGLARHAYQFSGPRKLFLRINDDLPGNGDGLFTCRVNIHR